MGDRALVVFKDDDMYYPAVYLHWDGSEVRGLLEAALPRLRQGDASYCTARFCGVCHEHIDGNLSLGVMPGPTSDDVRNKFKEYEHGDNGVFVVDASTFEVEQFHNGRRKGRFALAAGSNK